VFLENTFLLFLQAKFAELSKTRKPIDQQTKKNMQFENFLLQSLGIQFSINIQSNSQKVKRNKATFKNQKRSQ